jgi:hypothetical protein
MNNLPQNIKLTIHGEEIEFSLTDKREIKYYGKTETSNESLWRTDKLEDNEVFYQTEWGWGVFVKIEERELSLGERSFIANSNHNEVSQNIKAFTGIDGDHTLHKHLDDFNIPTKLITITYKDKTIESYE